MSERMTAERLALLKDIGENVDRYLAEACREIEALTKERDEEIQRYDELTKLNEKALVRMMLDSKARKEVWVPLLEAAEKYAYCDPIGTADLQDAVAKARNEVGE